MRGGQEFIITSIKMGDGFRHSPMSKCPKLIVTTTDFMQKTNTYKLFPLTSSEMKRCGVKIE